MNCQSTHSQNMVFSREFCLKFSDCLIFSSLIVLNIFMQKLPCNVGLPVRVFYLFCTSQRNEQCIWYCFIVCHCEELDQMILFAFHIVAIFLSKGNMFPLFANDYFCCCFFLFSIFFYVQKVFRGYEVLINIARSCKNCASNIYGCA